MGIIYKATNTVNNKCYIGITKNDLVWRRNRHHESAFDRNETNIFHKALRKYGKDAFKWEIVDERENYSDLLQAEQDHIKWCNSHYLAGWGYNMSWGGEDNGMTRERALKLWETRRKNGTDKPSIETKKKMSIARKGKKENPEVTRLLTEIRNTDEYKEKARNRVNKFWDTLKQNPEEYKRFCAERGKKSGLARLEKFSNN